MIVKLSDFKKGVSIVSNVVQKGISSITEGIRIKTDKENGYLHLYGNNLETSIRYLVKVEKDIEDFDFVVNQKLFDKIVSNLPDEEVKLSIKDSKTKTLSIRSGKTRFNIMISPSEIYPEFPNDTYNKTFEIDKNKLIEMINSIIFCSQNPDFRLMNSIKFEIVNDKFIIVSQDGIRLGYYEIPYEIGDINLQFLLSSKEMNNLVKQLNDSDCDVIKVSNNEGTIKFEFSNVEMVIRKIDGEYPDYRKIFYNDNTSEILIDRKKLMNALKRVSLLSKEEDDVKVIVDGDKMEVSTENPNVGFSNEIVEIIENRGENFVVYLNINLFYEIIKNIKSDNVVIKFKNTNTPIYIVNNDYQNNFYLLQGIRIN